MKEGGPLLDELNCLVMLPAAHSPLK